MPQQGCLRNGGGEGGIPPPIYRPSTPVTPRKIGGGRGVGRYVAGELRLQTKGLGGHQERVGGGGRSRGQSLKIFLLVGVSCIVSSKWIGTMGGRVRKWGEGGGLRHWVVWGGRGLAREGGGLPSPPLSFIGA